jgi:SAM-dependent methyltransferase
MSGDLLKQENYWDREVEQFDSIYSHQKGAISKFLDSLFRWDMFKRFEYTMVHAEPVENRTFLDVGCGTGRYSLELARRNARRIVGIDISENMIEVCRRRAQEEHLSSRTDFIHSDLLEYDPAEPVDTCIGIGLFDYIKDPLPVLIKMRRCSRRSVILSFPRVWTWRAPVRKARLALRHCDVYFYSLRRIRALLDSAGFGRIEHEKVGQLYCVTALIE